MDSRIKKRLISAWDKIVRFVMWLEKHGIPEKLIVVLIKLLEWWLFHHIAK